MQKWEYLQEHGFDDNRLKAAGADGWELVSVVNMEHSYYAGNDRITELLPVFYFKRPIDNEMIIKADEAEMKEFNEIVPKGEVDKYCQCNFPTPLYHQPLNDTVCCGECNKPKRKIK